MVILKNKLTQFFPNTDCEVQQLPPALLAEGRTNSEGFMGLKNNLPCFVNKNIEH